MTAQEQFAAEVEAFIEGHGIKPTNFGKLAVKDPGLVFDLRKGRAVSLRMVDRIRAFMSEYERQAA